MTKDECKMLMDNSLVSYICFWFNFGESLTKKLIESV